MKLESRVTVRALWDVLTSPWELSEMSPRQWDVPVNLQRTPESWASYIQKRRWNKSVEKQFPREEDDQINNLQCAGVVDICETWQPKPADNSVMATAKSTERAGCSEDQRETKKIYKKLWKHNAHQSQGLGRWQRTGTFNGFRSSGELLCWVSHYLTQSKWNWTQNRIITEISGSCRSLEPLTIMPLI